MSILVTGGTGYIGSHTCVVLLEAGYDVIIADNLYNSKLDVLDKLESITGKKPKFYLCDVSSKEECESENSKSSWRSCASFFTRSAMFSDKASCSSISAGHASL